MSECGVCYGLEAMTAGRNKHTQWSWFLNPTPANKTRAVWRNGGFQDWRESRKRTWHLVVPESKNVPYGGGLGRGPGT